ncbi:MAG: hypothetical protein AAGK21_16880 [Bacteroidota bacterium]
MTHRATETFWKRFEALPEHVQKLARKNHRLLEATPRYPSLHFKPLANQDPPLWSVRVGQDYRALAIAEDGVMYWFWIGTHAEYDSLLS